MLDTQWPRLYARGFFLGSQPVELLEEIPHFTRHDLTGAVLYVDSITELGIATAGDDWVVTVGKMLPLSTGLIQSRGAAIAEDLFALLQRDGFPGVETALYDIGGRYAVLLKTGEKIYAYNDAAGHRTVYFNHTQQRIASHFDMLHRLTDTKKLVCSMDSARPRTSPDGMWDLTEDPHIKALLPNHRLHLASGTQTRFALMSLNPYRALRWADRIDLIHRLWHEQLQHIFALSPEVPVGVSLSGGLDSRTVLAHLRPYVDRLRAFTYTSPNIETGQQPQTFWQRTMVTDHNVLQQMTDHLPEDFHVLVKPTRSNLTAHETAILERNAMRNHGRPFVPMYKAIFPNLQSIHLRGNFVEMGRFIRGRLDLPTKTERLAQVVKEVIRRRKPNTKRFTKFFWDKVDEFQYDLLHDDFEYTDVYHWENRSSRWYAEVANETDTVFDSIVPVNVRRIYEVLISPPVEVRPGARLQYDLIHYAWPELLAYGINSEDDLYTATLRDELVEE